MYVCQGHNLLSAVGRAGSELLFNGIPCRWAGIKPRSGPGGNPAIVLVQLQDSKRQLEELQAEAEHYTKVRPLLLQLLLYRLANAMELHCIG
jgi:hypothetical protein